MLMTKNSLQKNKNNNICQNTSSVLFINLESIKANYNLLKKKTNKSAVEQTKEEAPIAFNANHPQLIRVFKTKIKESVYFLANQLLSINEVEAN